MASQRRDPLFSHSPRRGSTSQMCLRRILTTITTVPPPALPSKEPPSSTSSAAGGSDVDHDDRGDRARTNLSLLIQAAQLISGEFGDGDELMKSDANFEQETGREFEESPAARSNRGRARVLPCRYRDSVREPLTRFSRTGSSILPPKRIRRWKKL